MARRLATVSVVAALVTACSALVDTGGLAGGGASSADGGAADTLLDGAAAADDARDPDVPSAPATSDRYGDAVRADGPIAYFRFEETSVGACANEIVGSRATCVLPSAGVTLEASGISATRKALRFDDAAATVNIFGATGFSGETPFTIEAWFQLDGPASGQVLLSNMDTPDNTQTRTGQRLYLLEGGASDGALQSETFNRGTHLFFGRTATRFPLGGWAHVVFLYSDALQSDALYVNAVAADAGRVAPGARTAAIAPLSFRGFKGHLDEVAIYSIALAPQRIAAHYASR